MITFDIPVTFFQYDSPMGIVDYSDPTVWEVKYSAEKNLVSVANRHDLEKTRKTINLNAVQVYKLRLGGVAHEATVSEKQGPSTATVSSKKNTRSKPKSNRK